MRIRFRIITVFVTLFSVGGWAHEIRPAYLELQERTPDIFDATWKIPMRGEAVINLAPSFSDEVHVIGTIRREHVGGAQIQRWRFQWTTKKGSPRTLTVEGLEKTLVDALVVVRLIDGTEHSALLNAAHPELEIDSRTDRPSMVGYFWLGVEHILYGVDHLLFVLMLLLLMNTAMATIKTVTAFTIAHSITLAGATLGLVRLPMQAVEALIAMSIVLIAAEAMRRKEGRSTLTIRRPWLIAFVFGLLHGFGFAGALSNIGVPSSNIPLALLTFNLGVEAGQILFILAAAPVVIACRRLSRPTAWLPDVVAPYVAGSIAVFWTLERLDIF